MKYVRTTYGTIYKKTLDNDLCLFEYGLDIMFEHVLNQADTIEELIDCYVVICEHQDKPLNVCKNEIEHYKHCLVDKVKSNNRVLTIYGAIWFIDDHDAPTLKSVAKMNGEGGLELL